MICPSGCDVGSLFCCTWKRLHSSRLRLSMLSLDLEGNQPKTWPAALSFSFSSTASPSPNSTTHICTKRQRSSLRAGMEKPCSLLSSLLSHLTGIFSNPSLFFQHGFLPWWKWVTFPLSGEHLGRYNLHFTACACMQGFLPSRGGRSKP